MKKKGRGSNLAFIEAALYSQLGKPSCLCKKIMEFTKIYYRDRILSRDRKQPSEIVVIHLYIRSDRLLVGCTRTPYQTVFPD